MENAPEMVACEAMTVAAVASPTRGKSSSTGASRRAQGWGADRDALDRRRHGNRRSQHRVAVEQRRSGYSRCSKRPSEARTVARRPRSEREKRKDAAFAAVVEAQHHGHVLQR